MFRFPFIYSYPIYKSVQDGVLVSKLKDAFLFNFYLFRFTPFSIPSEARMMVKGVKISDRQSILCNEKTCRLFLEKLSADSTGVYRCEIAGDAPDYTVVQKQANMTVMGKF